VNLLVTGGAGFIGSNFIEQVIDRPEIGRVANLDCLTYAGHEENLAGFCSHPRYVFEKVDLRDKGGVFEAVRKHEITHVVHLAAETHVDRSICGPDDFIHTNVVGTFHLLEACRAFWGTAVNDKRFVHVSTDEVFGTLGPNGYFTEQTPYDPSSPYSASKASSDMLVRAYHRTYGLPVLITNCSNNYGPRQFPEKLIPVVIQSALERKPIPVYGDGLNVRDWLYVCDHAEALWQVLLLGRAGESYNIGGENEQVNIRIVERICDLIDELAPHAEGTSRALIQMVRDRPGHDRRYAMEISKIRNELGWRPAWDFERALRETVQWYIQHQDWVATVLKR
jgi:dTDP-glucose 4,6-dehydratase